MRAVAALAFIVVALGIYVFVLPHLLEAMIGLAFVAKWPSALCCGCRWASPWECCFPADCVRFRLPAVRRQVRQARRHRVGVGHECRVERAGLGAGDRGGDSVWVGCDAGLRGCGVCARDIAAADVWGRLLGVSTWHFAFDCRLSAISNQFSAPYSNNEGGGRTDCLLSDLSSRRGL